MTVTPGRRRRRCAFIAVCCIDPRASKCRVRRGPGATDIAHRLLEEHERRYWTCQNIENDKPGTLKDPPVGDILFPHEQMMLRVCAGHQNAHFDLLGQVLLQGAIDYAAKQPEDYEINQLLLESIICCRLDYFIEHVEYEKYLRAYWDKRGQSEIREALIEVTKLEFERYKTNTYFRFPALPLGLVVPLMKALLESKEGKYVLGATQKRYAQQR
jgi:hypothetical protein